MNKDSLLVATRMVVVLAEVIGLRVSAACDVCHGTGVRDCDDPQCGDSTWDHACNAGGCDECRGKRVLLGALNLKSTTGATPRDAYVIGLVLEELLQVRKDHPVPYHSAHEGHAVMREELEELWDEVKANAGEARLVAEAKQVAQTAVRFLLDLCRIGCPACADSTCEAHPEQDQAGEYAESYRMWKTRNVAVWEAINAYARACNGDTSEGNLSGRRMDAAVTLERAIWSRP